MPNRQDRQLLHRKKAPSGTLPIYLREGMCILVHVHRAVHIRDFTSVKRIRRAAPYEDINEGLQVRHDPCTACSIISYLHQQL